MWTMARSRRRRMTLVSGLAAGALIVASGTSPAFAHDELVGSDPKNATTLAAAPEHVRLYFEETPGDGPTTLVVLGPDGGHVEAGPPTVHGSALTSPLRALTRSGRYLVRFAIMSDDGHPVSGTLTFTVTAAALHTRAPETDAAAAVMPGSRQEATLGWVAVATTVLLTIGAAASIAARRRRARPIG
jgi:copper resistance protein C